MKSRLVIFIIFLMLIPFISCRQKEKTSDVKIIFLHHSTGAAIWYGTKISLVTRAAKKINNRLPQIIGTKPQLPKLFEKYNEGNNKDYLIKEMEFPKISPYGWNNNPFDYYNIWVKNAGEKPYMEEPTLEILTKEYQVIIFKHCFPVSNIKPEKDTADIESYYQSLSNYKLQYLALRDKLNSFPDTKFILFTGAAQVKPNIKEDEAQRAREFFRWVTEDWDLPNDNIYIWDLYRLETEGEFYFKEEYAISQADSHPNGEFAGKAVKLLFNRIIDVIENNGERTQLTGERK